MSSNTEQDSKVSIQADLPSQNSILSQLEKEGVKLVDENGKLQLYSYLQCSNSDSDFLKQCRGLIFSGENLLVKTFPYTDEYNEKSDLSGVISNISEWMFFEAYEGALLRLFNFEGVWHLSTHKKLNAFKSKWSCSRSFGELFLETLKVEVEQNEKLVSCRNSTDLFSSFTSLLDTEKQYVFLVSNNEENRIVCEPMNRLFYIGCFLKVDREERNERNESLPSPLFSRFNPLKLSMPTELVFHSVEDLQNYVCSIDPVRTQGVFCQSKLTDKQVKVLNSEYQRKFAVRGNQSSLNFRYLEVRMNNELVNELKNLYPNSIPMFNKYEEYLKNIARYIHQSYCARFVHKKYTEVPADEYQVVKACHSWYLEDPLNRRVTFNKVVSVLNNQPAPRLNRMIKRIRFPKAQDELQARDFRSPFVVAAKPVGIVEEMKLE